MIFSLLAGCIGDQEQVIESTNDVLSEDSDFDDVPYSKSTVIGDGILHDGERCDETVYLEAGKRDNMEHDGESLASIEPSTPSSDLDIWINSIASQNPMYNKFDYRHEFIPAYQYDPTRINIQTSNSWISHTFDFSSFPVASNSNYDLKDAFIETAIRSHGYDASNDGFFLRYEGGTSASVPWSIQVDNTLADWDDLYPNNPEFTSWDNYTSSVPIHFIEFHLDSLPPTNSPSIGTPYAPVQGVTYPSSGSVSMISDIETNGFIDIIFMDDHIVDFYALTLCFESNILEEPREPGDDGTVGDPIEHQISAGDRVYRCNNGTDLSLTRIVMTAGSDDLFDISNADPAPSPSLNMVAHQPFSSIPFDELGNGADVLYHTFDWALNPAYGNNPNLILQDAYLSGRIASDGSKESMDDYIQILFRTAFPPNHIPNYDWRGQIGPDTVSDQNNGIEFGLYLDSLPTPTHVDLSTNAAGPWDLIPAFRESESLDVVFDRHHMVDHLVLDLCFKDMSGNNGGSFNCASPNTVESFIAGTRDNWDASSPDTNLPMSSTGSPYTAGLLAHMVNIPIKGVDNPMNEGNFAHSFPDRTNPVPELPSVITDAELSFGIRKISTQMNDPDFMELIFASSTSVWSPNWFMDIGNAADVGLHYTLDLGDLPLSNSGDLSTAGTDGYTLIPTMNSEGHLDIIFSNGIEVDYVELNLCIEEPTGWQPPTIPMSCEGWDTMPNPPNGAQVVRVLHGAKDGFDQTTPDPNWSPRDAAASFMDHDIGLYHSAAPVDGLTDGTGWDSSGDRDGDGIPDNYDATMVGYDHQDIDHWFVDSFTNLPNNIVDARLDFKLAKAVGNADYSSDGILLGFWQEYANGPQSWAHTGYIGSAMDHWDENAAQNFDPAFFPNGMPYGGQNVAWAYTPNTAAMFGNGGLEVTLHLSNLPSMGTTFNSPNSLSGSLSIIDLMNDNGFIDFQIQDDTMIDYLELTYCTLDPDADGDGIPNSVEGDDSVDTDGDGTPDYLDLDSDNDGIPDNIEGAVDTDQDGMPDYIDLDSDDDGMLDADEGLNDPDGDDIPNYLDTDSDNDGMLDWWEFQYLLDPYNPSDAELDGDEDGLDNLQEFTYRTDPANPDTDGGGTNDGTEVDSCTNPLDDSDDGSSGC